MYVRGIRTDKMTDDDLGRVSFYAYLTDGLCTYGIIRAEIRTKGNTNIKNSLIRICEADKNRADKVHRINNTHKSKHSLTMEQYIKE